MNNFDLIMLIITLIFTVVGFCRGAIKTILSVIGGILSYVVSVILGNKLAQPIYDMFFKKYIGKEISSRVSEIIEENGGNIGDSMLEALPDSLQMFVSDTDLVNSLNNVVGETNAQVVESATQIIQQVVEPITISLISVCAIFLLFILLNTLVTSVLFLADFVNKIPVIGKANRIAGAVIGLVAGLVLTCATVSVFGQLSPYIADDSEFSNNLDSSSVFFEIFANDENTSEISDEFLATELSTEGEYEY